MANETKETAKETAAKSSKDILGDIGPTLTYAKAVEVFGEDMAVEAMQTVARLGGHGMFQDDELTHPLFGGLQLPDPSKVIKPQRNEYPAGAIGDQLFARAGKDVPALEKLTADNRTKTMEALTALRG